MNSIRNKRRNRWRVKKAKRLAQDFSDYIYGYSQEHEAFDPETWDISEDEEEINYLLEECRAFPDGSCSLAGTEHCEWECPIRQGYGEAIA